MMRRQVEQAQLFYEFSLERHVPSGYLIILHDAAEHRRARWRKAFRRRAAGDLLTIWGVAIW